MTYRLRIYGDPDQVREEERYFNALEDAVISVEKRLTNDADDWQLKSGALERVDNNNGGPLISHTIHQVYGVDDHVTVHDEPVTHHSQ